MTRLFKTTLLAVSALTLVACGGADSKESKMAADQTDETPTISETTTPANDDAPKPTPIPEGSKAADVMILGSADAPVTLIEYASVTCPGCAHFHNSVLPDIKKELIDTGKLKLEFREYPTPPQQLAYIGFALSRCASDERGAPAYFAMLDTLFKNQKAWRSDQWETELTKYAATAGMSFDDLKACVQREDVIDAINANVKQGTEVDNVTGTPHFMLNGELFEDFKTYDEFKEQLRAAVEAAG